MAPQRPQATADFLQAQAVMRQVAYDLETDEIVKRIETLRAAPSRQLHRWPDKILLVPILNLPQAYTHNTARCLAVVSIHGPTPAIKMKTKMF
jgi:hypothetical protein